MPALAGEKTGGYVRVGAHTTRDCHVYAAAAAAGDGATRLTCDGTLRGGHEPIRCYRFKQTARRHDKTRDVANPRKRAGESPWFESAAPSKRTLEGWSQMLAIERDECIALEKLFAAWPAAYYDGSSVMTHMRAT